MNSQANPLSSLEVSRPGELVRTQLSPENTKFPSPIIHHWALQLHGVAPERINDTERLETLLQGTVRELELTQVSSHSHYFGPGVSTVIILSESHLAAHTWPELGYIHVDIVTCAQKFDAAGLENAFQSAFQPKYLQTIQVLY